MCPSAKSWVQIKIFEKTMGTDQFDLYPWFCGKQGVQIKLICTFHFITFLDLYPAFASVK